MLLVVPVPYKWADIGFGKIFDHVLDHLLIFGELVRVTILSGIGHEMVIGSLKTDWLNSILGVSCYCHFQYNDKKAIIGLHYRPFTEIVNELSVLIDSFATRIKN